MQHASHVRFFMHGKFTAGDVERMYQIPLLSGNAPNNKNGKIWSLGAVTHAMVSYPAVPHTLVLEYCLNQRSHVTNII